jgi:hypothetical protein
MSVGCDAMRSGGERSPSRHPGCLPGLTPLQLDGQHVAAARRGDPFLDDQLAQGRQHEFVALRRASCPSPPAPAPSTTLRSARRIGLRSASASRRSPRRARGHPWPSRRWGGRTGGAASAMAGCGPLVFGGRRLRGLRPGRRLWWPPCAAGPPFGGAVVFVRVAIVLLRSSECGLLFPLGEQLNRDRTLRSSPYRNTTFSGP